MNHSRLQYNRSIIAGKIVIGIDPSKDKHQAAVVDANGSQRGSSFSFPVSSSGYGETLWRGLARALTSESNAMHRLSVTYDRLRKALAQNRARVRSLLDRVFQEFVQILEPGTDSAVARYNLRLFDSGRYSGWNEHNYLLHLQTSECRCWFC
jgi:hypothetical protein